MDTDWPVPSKKEHACNCLRWCSDDRPCTCGLEPPQKKLCEDCEKLGIIVDNRAEEGYKYCWLCIEARKIELKENRRKQPWLAKLWQEPFHEAMEIFFEDIKTRRSKDPLSYAIKYHSTLISTLDGRTEYVAGNKE